MRGTGKLYTEELSYVSEGEGGILAAYACTRGGATAAVAGVSNILNPGAACAGLARLCWLGFLFCSNGAVDVFAEFVDALW